MIPGTGYEVEYERDKWIPVAFFVPLDVDLRGMTVMTLALVEGRLTPTLGKLRRAEVSA